MLGAAIKKDFHLLLRDRGALMSLFLLPIVFIAVFGSMFNGQDGSEREPRTIPVHYQPGDQRAAGLIEAVDRSGLFRTRLEPDAGRVRTLVADKTFAAGLIIPPDFDPRAGKPAELVIDEAAPPAIRGPTEGALDGILTGAHFGAPAAGPVTVLQARTPPGIHRPLEGARGFQVSVPGNAVLFGFFLALTVALSFTEERTTGTWRRLLAAPISRPVVLMAKLVPYVLIGLCQFAFLFGVGALAFGMRVAGSMVALVALTLAVVVCATALGLLLASLGGSERQLGGIGSITLLVMGLLGGAMVPRPIMPETMQTLGLFVPHAWALEGYYDVLIREGTTVASIWKEILALLGFAAAFAAIGVTRFRFER
jgi:ABC-2 type transport system permease protein